MVINDFESNVSIIKELGIRIKKYRISQSKTQEELANLSGVSILTIKGVENGKGCSLDTLIKILKSLNLSSNLNMLVPTIEISPRDISILGKERQRVSHKKVANKNIVWGEDK